MRKALEKLPEELDKAWPTGAMPKAVNILRVINSEVPKSVKIRRRNDGKYSPENKTGDANLKWYDFLSINHHQSFVCMHNMYIYIYTSFMHSSSHPFIHPSVHLFMRTCSDTFIIPKLARRWKAQPFHTIISLTKSTFQATHMAEKPVSWWKGRPLSPNLWTGYFKVPLISFPWRLHRNGIKTLHSLSNKQHPLEYWLSSYVSFGEFMAEFCESN